MLAVAQWTLGINIRPTYGAQKTIMCVPKSQVEIISLARDNSANCDLQWRGHIVLGLPFNEPMRHCCG